MNNYVFLGQAIATHLAATGTSIWNYVVMPLGWLFRLCYWMLPNFVMAMFLFAFIVKAALFPLDIKRQKSTAKMARFQPKILAIQKKYPNDKVKQNEETQRLYSEEGYNPAGGCLPTLLPLPIFIGLYTVIRQPLTYLLGMSSTILAQGQKVVDDVVNHGKHVTSYYAQLDILRLFHKSPELFTPAFKAAVNGFSMNFFGIDLTGYIGMTNQSWVYWIFPIITVLTSVLASYLMGQYAKKNNAGMPGANAASNPMMVLGMPLFTGFITYKFPAGVMLYWIFNSLLMIVSNMVLNRVWPTKKLAEIYEAEAALKPKGEVKPSRFRQKLSEAQKANAEKEILYRGYQDASQKRKREIERRMIASAREKEAEFAPVETVEEIIRPQEDNSPSLAPNKEARDAYIEMMNRKRKR